MGIKDWLQRKGEEKSASNIIDGLRPLVAAVRADMNELMNNELRRVAVQTAAMGAMVDGRQPWDDDTFAQFEQGLKRWRSRKIKVAEAQKKLFDDLGLWSSLPIERSLNEVVLPALTSGNLVAQSEPSYGAVVVAAYRVCEAVARQKGVSLEAHTPPAILQLVNDAGDLYKCLTSPKSPAVDAEQNVGKEFFEKKDYTRAAISFRKAAEEGDAEAQYRLSWMYYEGQGLQRDISESLKWKNEAANQGHVAALYERGWGEFLVTVKPVDYTQSYKWLTIAASRAINPEAREYIIKRSGIVAAEMTPTQIAEAARLAREWKPK